MRRPSVYFSILFLCLSFVIFQLLIWTIQYGKDHIRSFQIVSVFANDTQVNGGQHTTEIRTDKNRKPSEKPIDNNRSSSSPKTIDPSYFASKPVADSVQTLYEPGFGALPRRKCSSRHRYVVVVCSSPDHPSERDAIRNTWGRLLSAREEIHLVFLMGHISVGNGSAIVLQRREQFMEAIDAELEMFGDIVLANFVESYRNLTLKSTVMLEYLTRFCSHARAAVKVDDDMFINTGNLLKLLVETENTPGSIHGQLSQHWKPHRDPKNKYYVRKSEYDGAEYPNFVRGPCYIISGDLFEALFRTALRTKFFFLEDIFITGIVASQVDAHIVNAKTVTNSRKHNDCTIIKDVSLHKVSTVKMLIFHRKLVDGKAKCQPKNESISQPAKIKK